MGSYDVGLICLNGHCVNSMSVEYPDTNSTFCTDCGAKSINVCPACNKHIRGYYTESGIVSYYTVPHYCHNCGAPYPWTAAAIEAAAQMIAEDEQLTDEVKARTTESLPDILSDTPRTQLAAVRIKKAAELAQSPTAKAIRQFVIDFGSELAKKLIKD